MLFRSRARLKGHVRIVSVGKFSWADGLESDRSWFGMAWQSSTTCGRRFELAVMVCLWMPPVKPAVGEPHTRAKAQIFCCPRLLSTVAPGRWKTCSPTSEPFQRFSAAVPKLLKQLKPPPALGFTGRKPRCQWKFPVRKNSFAPGARGTLVAPTGSRRDNRLVNLGHKLSQPSRVQVQKPAPGGRVSAAPVIRADG